MQEKPYVVRGVTTEGVPDVGCWNQVRERGMPDDEKRLHEEGLRLLWEERSGLALCWGKKVPKQALCPPSLSVTCKNESPLGNVLKRSRRPHCGRHEGISHWP